MAEVIKSGNTIPIVNIYVPTIKRGYYGNTDCDALSDETVFEGG